MTTPRAEVTAAAAPTAGHTHAGAGHEDHAAHPHPGHVLLEIGGEVGALVIHTDPEQLGVEIEISPTGHDERRSHKDVLERTTGGHSSFAAVFDRLDRGTYTLWIDGVAQARGVRVTGGRIAELDWRSPPPPRAA